MDDGLANELAASAGRAEEPTGLRFPSTRLGADGVGIRARLAALVPVVLTIVAVAILYEAQPGDMPPEVLPTLLLFYGASTTIVVAFSLWTAASVGLPSFLMLSTTSGPERLLRWLVYGVALGAVLAAGSVILGSGEEGALRPWFWRRIQTPGGAMLLSARGALLEETFFRLFLIPALVSAAVRTHRGRYRLELHNGSAQAVSDRPAATRAVVLVAAAVSCLLFGLAHPFNPLGAIVLGPLLALSYLWGGWESAVTAHFVANGLVFLFYY